MLRTRIRYHGMSEALISDNRILPARVLLLFARGGYVFAQLKVIVDLVRMGVTDAWSLKTKRDRRRAVLRMLETYFLLKDCLDDGRNLILEAGSNPLATINSISASQAKPVIERWDCTLRKQGIRLQRLHDYLLCQDHLSVVAPDVQDRINRAIGSKFNRVTNLQAIGASLFFYNMFPVVETPAEKAQYIVMMAGGQRDAISLPRIKREVRALAEALDKYRAVVEKLVPKEDIVKLSSQARQATAEL